MVCERPIQNKYYGKKDYRHPLAVKNYHNKHLDYIKNKTELVNKLCKKHHLWPRNENNRKLDILMFKVTEKINEIKFTITLRNTLKKASRKQLMIIEQELNRECKRRQKATWKK